MSTAEDQLRKKITEWLTLRGEVDALEKARFEEGPSDRQKRAIRQARAEAEMKPTGTTEQFSPKGKITPIGQMQRWKSLRELKQMPKPNLPKTEKAEKPVKPKMHEDIVAGIKVPHFLKQHSGPVPRNHPHREMAAKFVADVWKKNVPAGRKMSERYLGIGAPEEKMYGRMKKAAISSPAGMQPTVMKQSPAIALGSSDPMSENRDQIDHPKTINGPMMLTNIVKSLQKRKLR